MKAQLILLIAMFGTSSQAQPIYRCVDSLGHVAYGGLPCEPAVQGGDENQLQTDELALQRPSNLWATPEAPVIMISASNRGLREQRDQRVAADLNARKSLVRRIRKPLDERTATGFAENRRRCAGAERAAELCGQAAVSCGERGFRPAAAVEARTAGLVAVDKRNSFKMARCALQANGGGER